MPPCHKTLCVGPLSWRRCRQGRSFMPALRFRCSGRSPPPARGSQSQADNNHTSRVSGCVIRFRDGLAFQSSRTSLSSFLPFSIQSFAKPLYSAPCQHVRLGVSPLPARPSRLLPTAWPGTDGESAGTCASMLRLDHPRFRHPYPGAYRRPREQNALQA